MPKRNEPQEHKTLPIYLVSTDDAEGIVEAVVNVFGMIDLGDDVIHNGAYTKTLSERGNQVKVRVLDSHDTSSILSVIGKPLEIREVGRDELGRLAPEVLRDHPEATGGLYTKTQFLLNTPEGDGAYKRLAAGAVDEWSIALDALQVEYGKMRTPEGKERVVRHIYQIKLYEYSPVIWGMNQATATTAVKSADEALAPGEDKGALSPEQKQGSLASKLEANMRMGYAYCVNDWLAYGVIDSATISLLDMALTAGMSAFRSAIPDEVADVEIEYWEAQRSAEQKAGRMISARNRTQLEQAIAALQAVLDAADANQADDDAEATEDEDKKASTGPDAQETPSGDAPSIAAADEVKTSVPVDPAEIDREFAELSVMMEMGYELQGNH